MDTHNTAPVPSPLQAQLEAFWAHQLSVISRHTDFRTHNLPLARIKKIMKADEDVRMIAAEAPVLFSKACELFILNLMIRAWSHASRNKRRTVQKEDVARAIRGYEYFDFLVDVVGEEEGGNEITWQEIEMGGMGDVVLPMGMGMPMPMPTAAWHTGWDGLDPGFVAQGDGGASSYNPSQ